MPSCCQCLSPSILWIVYTSVTYWKHSTTVCALMAGKILFQLAYLPHHPVPIPSPPYTWHPWYYRGCKKLFKSQQVILHFGGSYETLTIRLLYTYTADLTMTSYNVAQENHSWFNISKWYFSKYKGLFCKFSHIRILLLWHCSVKALQFYLHALLCKYHEPR